MQYAELLSSLLGGMPDGLEVDAVLQSLQALSVREGTLAPHEQAMIHSFQRGRVDEAVQAFLNSGITSQGVVPPFTVDTRLAHGIVQPVFQLQQRGDEGGADATAASTWLQCREAMVEHLSSRLWNG